MKKIVAVYEREEAYGRKLADYLNRKEHVPFEVQVFSEADKLSAYLQGHTPELLLLSEEDQSQYGGKNLAKEVMYLSSRKESGEQEDCIYKYQPTDQILHQLMRRLNCREREYTGISEASALIYGVYSPVGRSGKTTFALLLGEILSRNRSAVYIGFEDFAIQERRDGQVSTLSDAFFYHQKHCLGERIRAMTSHWHGLDVLAGVTCPEDIQSIQGSEWAAMVEEIARNSGYDAIVLDMGTKLWLAGAMFSICSHIYVPVLEDVYARECQKNFENWMENELDAVVREKIHTVRIPMEGPNGCRESRLEYALWGETGDYIRNLIRSEW